MSIKKSLNLNYQQLLRWKENPEINPKTGKAIKLNGPAYTEIQRLYDKYMEKYTEEECNKWIKNKNMNPKTDKYIKEGKKTYERIRNQCEQYVPEPSVSLIEFKQKEYVEDIEEDTAQSTSTGSVSVIQKFMESCKNCTVRLATNMITNMGCVDRKCMVKGCPWNGRFGLNLSRVPKAVKSFILAIIIKFIYVERCCCVCFGHLIFILYVYFFQYQIRRTDELTRESLKIQKTIDKIEASTDYSKGVEKVIAAEANTQVSKYITKTITNPRALIKEVLKYVYFDKSTNKDNFLAGIEELDEELLISSE